MIPAFAAICLSRDPSASLTVCHASGAEDPAEGVAQTVAKPKPGPGPPHRERAAEPSAAEGPSAHRRNALRGKLHPRTSPGAGRHLEGAKQGSFVLQGTFSFMFWGVKSNLPG